MSKNKNILDIIKFSKTIINKDIFLFLYNLFKYIFIKRENNFRNSYILRHLDSFIKRINIKIIKDENKYINKEYSMRNFNNIISFVKTQNVIFSGDIIESILIYIFSFAFEESHDYNFGRDIFINFYNLEKYSNIDLVDMFKTDNFNVEELEDLNKTVLIDDCYTFFQKNFVIYNLLFKILYEKYINLQKKDIKKNISMNYINRGFSEEIKSNDIYKKLYENSETILDKDFSISIMNLITSLNFPSIFIKISKVQIKLIRSFLIQVFIYNHNKNSLSMDYKIPFAYDLKGACLEERFASIIITPARIEPRINKIILSQNNLRESGLYEIGKAIIFNKSIRNIDLNNSFLKNNYLDYLNIVLGLFDNYSVEELNLSYNKLEDISEENFAKIIIHFKKLKTLNLNINKLKNGISTFLIVLKNLYCKGETKLENLYLEECILNDESFYELGELLKCKYCKLKKLYLNKNILPNNINFLKKLKKNKSLTEIHFNETGIGNNEVDDIMRIISNSDIRNLYLQKNKIINYNESLKLLYRTKIIKDEKEFNNIYLNNNKKFLSVLDLINNVQLIKSEYHAKVVSNLINQTTLNPIDISHILYGPNPYNYIIDNNNACKSVKIFEKYLKKEKNEFIKDIKKVKNIQIDINRLKKKKDEKIIDIPDEIIMKILNNKKAKFTIYLKEEARKLIKDNVNINSIDKKELINIENKLADYMKLKRLEKEMEKLKKE